MKDISTISQALQNASGHVLPSDRLEPGIENAIAAEENEEELAFEEPQRPTWQPVALEDEILATFDASPQEFESVAVAFQRKEHALAEVFSRLSAVDSLALKRRLDLALPGDPIAARFGRLVVDRRTRLLAFLADARRRIAIHAARAGGRRD